MQEIIFFFVRNKNLLLFLLLFSISILLTINTHSYHQNKFSTSANDISGKVYQLRSGVTDYFDLRIQNDLLQQENRMLRQGSFLTADSTKKQDSPVTGGLYDYTAARVINNSIAKTRNYLTIDKGEQDNVSIDMGVISPRGVVGIVHDRSKRYATVQSVLNTNSQVSAKLKKSGHFGTLVWEGEDPYRTTLIDISSQVEVAVGDTVVTDGKSTIFPEGILIGVIDEVGFEANRDYYKLAVKLATDMTSVEHIYLVNHRDRNEINELESRTEDAEQ
jgi:rod shape-determining protein MreC